MMTWDAVDMNCQGLPELMGHYELFSTPIRFAGQPPDWTMFGSTTLTTHAAPPDPPLGEAVWFLVETVDAAGNRSSDPCGG